MSPRHIWAVVRKELDRVGYNGWMTIEGGGLSVPENIGPDDFHIAFEFANCLD